MAQPAAAAAAAAGIQKQTQLPVWVNPSAPGVMRLQGMFVANYTNKSHGAGTLAGKGCKLKTGGNELRVFFIPDSQRDHFMQWLLSDTHPNWGSSFATKLMSTGFQPICETASRLKNLSESYMMYRHSNPDPNDPSPSRVALKTIPMEANSIVLFAGVHMVTAGRGNREVLYLNICDKPLYKDELPATRKDCEGGPPPHTQQGLHNPHGCKDLMQSVAADDMKYGWTKETVPFLDRAFFESNSGFTVDMAQINATLPDCIKDARHYIGEEQGYYVIKNVLSSGQLAALMRQMHLATQQLLLSENRNMKPEDRAKGRAMSPMEFCSQVFKKHGELPHELRYFSGRDNYDVTYDKPATKKPVYRGRCGFSLTGGIGDLWWLAAEVLGTMYRHVSKALGEAVYPGPDRYGIRNEDSTVLPPHIDCSIYQMTTGASGSTGNKRKLSQIASAAPTNSASLDKVPDKKSRLKVGKVVEFVNDAGDWQAMDAELSALIYKASITSTSGLFAFRTGGYGYTVNFNKMQQTNTKTGKVRVIRFSDAKGATATGALSTPCESDDDDDAVPSPDTVEYEDDDGSWKPFGEDLTLQICDAWRQRIKGSMWTSYSRGGFDYVLCFNLMVQTNTKTKKKRKVRFTRSCHGDEAATMDVDDDAQEDTGYALFENEKGEWQPHGRKLSDDLWDAYISGQARMDFCVGGRNYEVSFVTMHQQDMVTTLKRRFRFEDEEMRHGSFFRSVPTNTRVEISSGLPGDWRLCKPRETSFIYHSKGGTCAYDIAHNSIEFHRDTMQRHSGPKLQRHSGPKFQHSEKVRFVTEQCVGDVPWLYEIKPCILEAQPSRGNGTSYAFPTDLSVQGLFRQWIENRSLSFTRPGVVLEPTTSSLYKEMEALIEGTAADTPMPRGSKLVSVERCYARGPWKAHWAEIQRMFESNGTVECRKVLHGCSPEVAEKIEKFGPDAAYAGSSTGSMYGKGIYGVCFGDPGYAHRYTSPDKDIGGVRSMFVFNLVMTTLKQGTRDQATMSDGLGGHHVLCDDPSKPRIFCSIQNAKVYAAVRLRYTAP